MGYKVQRWEGPGGPTEESIMNACQSEGLSPYRWGNSPGDRYPAHEHSYHKVLYCLTGSITFSIAGTDLQLLPGDRLDLDPRTQHEATVGPEGVTCLEANR